MAQKDWHIDGKGKIVHPKREGGKFASKKGKAAAKPAMKSKGKKAC